MEYRVIIYLSNAVISTQGARLPVDLMKITQLARKANPAHDVTGLLSYTNGYYCQVLEGNKVAIEKLFNNIFYDDRHSNIQVLVDTTTQKRYFDSWSNKIVGLVDQEPNFKAFIKDNSSFLGSLDKAQASLLSMFTSSDNLLLAVKVPNSANKHNSTSKSVVFEDKSLRLRSWPDFTKVKQTSSVIELSARLVGSSHNYWDLVNSGDFGKKEKIDSTLLILYKTGLLITSDTVKSSKPVNEASKANKFYKKMKSLLSLR